MNANYKKYNADAETENQTKEPLYSIRTDSGWFYREYGGWGVSRTKQQQYKRVLAAEKWLKVVKKHYPEAKMVNINY